MHAYLAGGGAAGGGGDGGDHHHCNTTKTGRIIGWGSAEMTIEAIGRSRCYISCHIPCHIRCHIRIGGETAS